MARYNNYNGNYNNGNYNGNYNGNHNTNTNNFGMELFLNLSQHNLMPNEHLTPPTQPHQQQFEYASNSQNNSGPATPGSSDSSMGSILDEVQLDMVAHQLLSASNATRNQPSPFIETVEHQLISEMRDLSYRLGSPDHQLPYDLKMDIAGLPTPLMMHSPQPPQISSCYIHGKVYGYCCQTCGKLICEDCAGGDHSKHAMIHLDSALQSAEVSASEVIRNSAMGIDILRDDLEKVKANEEYVISSASQAITDVTDTIQQIVALAMKRGRELIMSIEEARQTKLNELSERRYFFSDGLNTLISSSRKIHNARSEMVHTNNPFVLLKEKDKAMSQMFRISQKRNIMRLKQPDPYIAYVHADVNDIRQLLAIMGSIMLTNPGSIGDRRAIQNSVSPRNHYQESKSPPHYSKRHHQHRSRQSPVADYVLPKSAQEAQDVTEAQLQPPPFRPVQIIGNIGEPDDCLCRPWGVACDPDGNIIVADRSNNRLMVYRKDGSVIRRIGSVGSGEVQFDRPAGIAVDARKRIIVADKDNHRIQILTLEGLFVLAFGEKGNACGQFNYPWDVAVNPECQIVVSDTRNHRIQLFSPEGVFLKKFGHEAQSSHWKNFDSPRGVAFAPDGRVVVTDFNNHSVSIIDTNVGTIVNLGKEGDEKNFQRPQGVVVDENGNMVVADSRNHRIQVFNSSGKLLWRLGTYGSGPNEMERPSGVALCPDGRIAVVDFGNNRVLLI